MILGPLPSRAKSALAGDDKWFFDEERTPCHYRPIRSAAMHDIKYIRDNTDAFVAGVDRRGGHDGAGRYRQSRARATAPCTTGYLARMDRTQHTDQAGRRPRALSGRLPPRRLGLASRISLISPAGRPMVAISATNGVKGITPDPRLQANVN